MIDRVGSPQNFKFEILAGCSQSRASYSIGSAVIGEIRN